MMGTSKFLLIHLVAFYIFTFTREAWVIFKARKNYDGFFDTEKIPA
jgi:hypothetical protein